MPDPAENHVYEPEVLPPETPIETAGVEVPAKAGLKPRLEKAFGPILAGLVIDFVDLTTFGPMGLFFGMLVGGAAGYWICSIYDLPMRQRLLWALAAGAYCTVPMTEVIPLATLMGAYLRFRGVGTKLDS